MKFLPAILAEAIAIALAIAVPLWVESSGLVALLTYIATSLGIFGILLGWLTLLLKENGE